MVSQDPHTPDPPPESADDLPKPPTGPQAGGVGWRWWFAAAGPWVGVAAAIAAIATRR